MSEQMRFFICTMAEGRDWLEGAMVIMAHSSDEAAAVFKEHEAVSPLKTYEVTGVGMKSGIVGRIGKVGQDGS